MLDSHIRPDQSPPVIPDHDSSDVRLRIFRKEVLERSRPAYVFGITLAHSGRNWLVFGFVVAFGLSLMSLVTFGDISKRVHLTGIVVPAQGSATASSPSAGTLTKIFVSEGQLVKEGDLLFEVSADHNSSEGSATASLQQRVAARQTAVAREAAAVNAQNQHRSNELRLKLLGAQQQLSMLNEQISLMRHRIMLAQKRGERLAALVEQGFYSNVQHEEDESKALELQVGLGALIRSKTELLTSISSMESEAQAAQAGNQTSLAQLDRMRATLDQEAVELETRSVIRTVATRSGRVTNIAYGPGQIVAAGQMLMNIMPEDEEIGVELFAPSHAIGRVRVGQSVSVRYHAFPYQHYGRRLGTIVELGRTPFAPNELPNSIASSVLSRVPKVGPITTAMPEGLYRIKVVMTRPGNGSERLALKAGMTLDADIIVGKVKIWRWLFEPFGLDY
jgi:membrane fusion protein